LDWKTTELYQNKKELDQKNTELDQHKKEIDQNKIELDWKTTELYQNKKELDQKNSELDQHRKEIDQNKIELDWKTTELNQNKKELDQKNSELDQHKKKIDQNKIELDLMIAELEKERQLRQVVEQHLDQYERGQHATSQGRGSAEPTAERLFPIASENTMMRTISTQGSTYQKEGGDNPTTTTTTDTMRTSTRITKEGSFPGPMATALTEQAFSLSSSSFLKTPPSSSVVVVRRRLTTTTVTTQAELVAALANSVTIVFAADILLTSEVSIDGLTGLVINGKGFKIDGNNAVRCFRIDIGTEVAFANLTITRGSSDVSFRINICFDFFFSFSVFRLLLSQQDIL
jgi:hypothetical protein